MTTTLSVRCQHCGAPLQISDGIRFLTCNYCKTELEVVHSADVTHTRVLQSLVEQAGQIDDRLKVIELQHDLDRLEREWDKWQERNLGSGKDGSLTIPSANVISFAAVAGLVLFILSIVMAFANAGEPSHWAPFFFLALLAGMRALSERTLLRRYKETRLLYENRRTVLQHRLDAARGA